MNKTTTSQESVFNRVRMGYAVIESRKTDAWRLGRGVASLLREEFQPAGF